MIVKRRTLSAVLPAITSDDDTGTTSTRFRYSLTAPWSVRTDTY